MSKYKFTTNWKKKIASYNGWKRENNIDIVSYISLYRRPGDTPSATLLILLPCDIDLFLDPFTQ